MLSLHKANNWSVLSAVYLTNKDYMFNLPVAWEEVKEKLKETNPLLTDADLYCQPGEEKKLLTRLAKKMNRSEEHIKGWIESVAVNEGKAS